MAKARITSTNPVVDREFDNVYQEIRSISGEITPGDMTKAVYDPTSVNGDVFDMANMNSGINKTFYADNAGNVIELSHGDSGKVLTSNGTTSAPSWETATGGDSFLVTQIFS